MEQTKVITLFEAVRLYGPILRRLESQGLTRPQAAWWILRSSIRFQDAPPRPKRA